MEEKYIYITRVRVAAHGGDARYAFGHGTAQLLQGVTELKSLNRAAQRMGMAYSKAWKSIRDTEAQLGVTLMERRAQHGSVLTDEGTRFLNAFLEAERRASDAARQAFTEFGF